MSSSASEWRTTTGPGRWSHWALRELNRQLQLKEFETAQLITILNQKNDDLELAALAQATSTFSPLPLILTASLNSVAQLDANQVVQICTRIVYDSMKTFEAKIIQLLDTKLSALTQVQRNSNNNSSGNSISVSSVSSVSSNDYSSKNITAAVTAAAHTVAPTENGGDSDHGTERTPQYPRFALILIIGDYETTQQQQQQQNYCRGNKRTKHFTKYASYNNLVTWSAH